MPSNFGGKFCHGDKSGLQRELQNLEVRNERVGSAHVIGRVKRDERKCAVEEL